MEDNTNKEKLINDSIYPVSIDVTRKIVEQMEKSICKIQINGEIGTVIQINETDKSITIKFDDEKTAIYTYSDLEQIEHSYAITIHKAQGSEYDVVIMCVPRTAPILLTRNLLYTGITRAKELLIVIGDKKIIEFMIQNVDSKKRNTGLKFKLMN